MKTVYRKERLYYHKFGYRINEYNAGKSITSYIKKNFKKDDYMINDWNGLYFKNEKDAKKVAYKFRKRFKKMDRTFYAPDKGFENCIVNNHSSPKLYYDRFPYKLTVILRKARGLGVKHAKFKKIIEWCGENLDNPYYTIIPHVYFISKIDVITFKLKFAEILKFSGSINNEWTEKLLIERIRNAQNDLNLFLNSK